MKLDKLRLKHPELFTTIDARSQGVSPQLLKHYLTQGLIERVSHGVYRFPSNNDISLESLIQETLKAVPQGVISHRTALRLFGLTEDAPAEIDLLVPDKNIPKRKLENVKLHPVVQRMMRHGVMTQHGIKVTCIERTLVDLLRGGEPLSLVITAFREAQNKKLKPSLAKIRRMGVLLHAKAKTDLFLKALL